MKAVDPTIKIVPNGNTAEWWQTVLTKTSGYIDDICVSNYPVSVCDTVKNLTGPADIALESIKKYTSPENQKRFRVIVAEYGPFSWCNNAGATFVNTMYNNLVNIQIGFQWLQDPGVIFSYFWNTRWINDGGGKYSSFDALDKNGYFNANGYGLMILGKFLGNKMIKTIAGNELKTYASIDDKQNKLYLYAINNSNTPITIHTDFKNRGAKSISSIFELIGKSADDTKLLWTEIKALPSGTRQVIKPFSIRVLVYWLQ